MDLAGGLGFTVSNHLQTLNPKPYFFQILSDHSAPCAENLKFVVKNVNFDYKT